MLKMAAFAKRETGMRDLCLAGGVALNCVGNGRLLREKTFDQLWIQPAAGDAGGAVGIALACGSLS
jgi:carbamoyltransferase